MYVQDNRQQEHIEKLERQLSNLTTVVSRMEVNMEKLHYQLVERHMTLMVIEVIVLAIIISVCLGRPRATVVIRSESPRVAQVKQLSIKDKPPDERVKGTQPVKVKGHQRAVSLDVTPKRGRAFSMDGEGRVRTDTERTKSGKQKLKGTIVFTRNTKNKIRGFCSFIYVIF